jgi:hypothetical protein
VPLDGQRYGIGQIAGDWKGELYIVIYDKLVFRDASTADVNGAGLWFAALTLDAKFYHGDWPVVGNRQDNLQDLPQPWFKVGVDGEDAHRVTRQVSNTPSKHQPKQHSFCIGRWWLRSASRTRSRRSTALENGTRASTTFVPTTLLEALNWSAANVRFRPEADVGVLPAFTLP